jgi:tetratricopeptide (TPR) repeat protein
LIESPIEQALKNAMSFHRGGQLAAAESIYRQVLAAQPNHSVALHRLGLTYYARGRFQEAMGLMRQAIALAPSVAEFHSDLGLLFRQLGHLAEALDCLQRAAKLRPELPWIQVNLGQVLFAVGKTHEAIACYRRALELQPVLAEAENSLGNALTKLGQREEGRQHLERAVQIHPDFAYAWSNLGSTLLELDRIDEAIVCGQRAIALQPHLAPAYVNLGSAWLRKGVLGKALDAYRWAVNQRPDLANARNTLGIMLLLSGQYEEGWKEYEQRWNDPEWVQIWRHIPVPRWDGQPLAEGTIWLHAEQGLGDTLHFFRYLACVRERSGGGQVGFVCPPALVRLLTSAPDCPAAIVSSETWDAAHLPPTDRFLPLMSLPAVLGLYEPRTICRPYLEADPALRAAWRLRLAGVSGLKVGLIWAGNPAHKRDRQRSLRFEQLAPLLRLSGVTLVSAQIGPQNRAEDLSSAGVIEASTDITDFADTAALFAELDLIISADTATAHLAGALGRPVWTLLPAMPDWRWGLEGDSTPWYPSMRLFRQKTAGDWAEVIERVAFELRTMPAGFVESDSRK